MRLSVLAVIVLSAWCAAASETYAENSLTEAEQKDVFAAAGFKMKDGSYTRCEDDVTASHMPGYLEETDLNGDGRPEVFVKESSLFCYGNTAEAFVLVTKSPSGAWLVILDQIGVPVTRDTKTNGWLDIEVGGPGAGPFPVYKFDGTQYIGGP